MKSVDEFSARSQSEQEWMLSNTWCDFCNEADLGIKNPREYKEDKKIFLSGQCNKCGNLFVSEVKES